MNEKTYTYALNIQTTGEKETNKKVNSVTESLKETGRQAEEME